MSSFGVLYGVFRIHGERRDIGDVQEQRPVANPGVEHPEDRIRAEVLRRAGRPRVAVLRRFERVLGADRAGGARLVHDDDLLSERLLDLRRRHAGDLVGRSARRPRHDDGDGLRRLPLLRRRGRGDRQRQHRGDPDDSGEHQRALAAIHTIPPLCSWLREPGMRVARRHCRPPGPDSVAFEGGSDQGARYPIFRRTRLNARQTIAAMTGIAAATAMSWSTWYPHAPMPLARYPTRPAP